jgi:anti-sigma factor (TIGR02949 family)
MAKYNNQTDCDWAEAHLDAFVDGDVQAEEEARLTRHLGTCDSCKAMLDEARDIRAQLNALPQEECPERVLAAVLARIEKEEGAKRPRRARRPFWTGQSWGLRLVTATALTTMLIVCIAHDSGNYLTREPAQPSAEELALAEQQLELTLAYVGYIGRRSARAIRDDVLDLKVVTPVRAALIDKLIPWEGPTDLTTP